MYIRHALLIACGLAAAVVPNSFAAELDFPGAVGDLTDLEALTRVDYAPVRMISTYDRAGGNNDDFIGKWRKGDIFTIADLTGPGVIRRIYSAKPGGHLRIYIDGEEKPSIDMLCAEFFSGQRAPFLRPMVGPMGGGSYSFFPIPFAKSIRIQVQAVRPAQFAYGVYYQVTYQAFDTRTAVRSLALPLGGADAVAWESGQAVWRRVGEDPKPPASGQQNVTNNISAAPGKTAEIARLEGPGTIDRLLLKLSSRDVELLRSTLLRIRFDDEPKWAVDTPLGDFFGNAFDFTPYKSLPMGLTDDGFYCYFSMPFQRAARILLVNQDGGKTLSGESRVVWHRTEGMPTNAGYFHAKWRREDVVATDRYYRNQSGEYNYHALDAEGQGRYVGLSFNVFNRHTAWWGEGDPMIFVDDDTWPPSIHGTGTEEYFNDAWGFHQFIQDTNGVATQERNIIPVSGVLVNGAEDRLQGFGGNALFTFHLADSVAFRSRIRVTLEHGQEQNDLANDYSSTAYWYARPRGRDFFIMRPARERTTIPAAEWPERRKAAERHHLEWLRETLADWAAAIPAEPNDDRLARPRAVFLMWLLGDAENLGLPRAERETYEKRWKDFQGTEPEKRQNVDRILLELADRLKVRE